jgi:hypothetical protein
MTEPTIYQHLSNQGVSRRDFLKLCGLLAGAMGLRCAAPVQASGLPAHLAKADETDLTAETVARALERKPRVPVI